MGMPHRGRLNVLANVLRKPYEMILAEFEGTFLPADVQGDGDVKYHLGYARDHVTRGGRKVHVSLLLEPEPPRGGRPGGRRHRARQAGLPQRRRRRPGDAAAHPRRRRVHRPGHRRRRRCRSPSSAPTAPAAPSTSSSTTRSASPPRPEDYRFTRYASDVAKIIQAPVFHVNGNDPEAAVQAARLAAAFRTPVQGRRHHRPGLLPPPRPQRDRRSDLHPAADVQDHRARCRRCATSTRGA